MSAEHEIAAPASLARLEAVSPWKPVLPTSRARRWLAAVVDAWREGMELYVRAMMVRGARPWWL